VAAIGIDHLMWGASSLASGVSEAHRLLGAAPAAGGVHPGRGTQNALLSLGESVYLEVIAPDPAQNLEGTLGARLTTLRAPGLITWAAAAPDLEAVAASAAAMSLRVRGPVDMRREAPDGTLLAWRLLFLSGHAFGNLVPFFIDWQNTPHPAHTNPSGGRFIALEIGSPAADELNDLYAALGVAQRAVATHRPALTARILAAAGEVLLHSAEGTDTWAF